MVQFEKNPVDKMAWNYTGESSESHMHGSDERGGVHKQKMKSSK